MRLKPSFLISVLFALAAVAVLYVLKDSSPSQFNARRLFGFWTLPQSALAGGLFVISFMSLCAALSRDAFMGAIVMLVSGLMFIGAAEALGRSGLIAWDNLLGGQKASVEKAGWDLIPNHHSSGTTYQDIAARYGLKSDPIAYDFQSDQHGFRNETNTTGDIIVLGDSIVLGIQVPAEETVAAQIEQDLGIKTSQAALLGISIQQQHQMFLEAGISPSGKTIVQFFFEGNDVIDSQKFRMAAEANQSSTKSGVSFYQTVWGLLTKLTDKSASFSGTEHCEIQGQPYLFLWTQRSYEGLETELPDIQSAILEFSKQITSAGGRYAMVYVPSKWRVMSGQCSFPATSTLTAAHASLPNVPDMMMNWAAEQSIPMLDLTPALSESAQINQAPWLWGDTHWSSTGHAIAGREIADWMRLHR